MGSNTGSGVGGTNDFGKALFSVIIMHQYTFAACFPVHCALVCTLGFAAACSRHLLLFCMAAFQLAACLYRLTEGIHFATYARASLLDTDISLQPHLQGLVATQVAWEQRLATMLVVPMTWVSSFLCLICIIIHASLLVLQRWLPLLAY